MRREEPDQPASSQVELRWDVSPHKASCLLPGLDVEREGHVDPSAHWAAQPEATEVLAFKGAPLPTKLSAYNARHTDICSPLQLSSGDFSAMYFRPFFSLLELPAGLLAPVSPKNASCVFLSRAQSHPSCPKALICRPAPPAQPPFCGSVTLPSPAGPATACAAGRLLVSLLPRPHALLPRQRPCCLDTHIP